MILRASAVVALVLVVAFAVPVAVEVWLRDGHVTLEQGLRHAQAVAEYGAHEHGAPSAAAASARQHRHAPTPAATTDAGPVLITTTAPTPFGVAWYAVAVTQAVLLALSAGRSRQPPLVHAPRTHIPDRLLPPPRRPAHA